MRERIEVGYGLRRLGAGGGGLVRVCIDLHIKATLVCPA